jgi:hypothetical protein
MHLSIHADDDLSERAQNMQGVVETYGLGNVLNALGAVAAYTTEEPDVDAKAWAEIGDRIDALTKVAYGLGL